MPGHGNEKRSRGRLDFSNTNGYAFLGRLVPGADKLAAGRRFTPGKQAPVLVTHEAARDDFPLASSRAAGFLVSTFAKVGTTSGFCRVGTTSTSIGGLKRMLPLKLASSILMRVDGMEARASRGIVAWR